AQRRGDSAPLVAGRRSRRNRPRDPGPLDRNRGAHGPPCRGRGRPRRPRRGRSAHSVAARSEAEGDAAATCRPERESGHEQARDARGGAAPQADRSSGGPMTHGSPATLLAERLVESLAKDHAHRAVDVALSKFSIVELAALASHWPFWARPKQLSPTGSWRTW